LPILKLTMSGREIHLIPSLCHESSLPKGFTRGKN
jgi:hypothetical protein